MPIVPFLPKLSWLSKRFTGELIGAGTGVTGRAVNYWLTGERMPSSASQQAISRLFERAEYGEMRLRGLVPNQAAKYRGLSPDSFDAWTERLEGVADHMNKTRADRYLDRNEIDRDDVSDEFYDALVDSYDEGTRDAFDYYGGDVEDIEEYFGD